MTLFNDFGLNVKLLCERRHVSLCIKGVNVFSLNVGHVMTRFPVSRVGLHYFYFEISDLITFLFHPVKNIAYLRTIPQYLQSNHTVDVSHVGSFTSC